MRFLRIRRALRPAIGLLAIAVGHAALAAADAIPDDYRSLFVAGAANGAYPALSVGFVDAAGTHTAFFGNGHPDADSRYEIGATSDLFAGLLLGQAVLDGKLRLDTKVRSVLADDFPWHGRAVADTTLLALAAQSAGFPAQPANLFPADQSDPYRAYGRAELLTWLANYDGAAASRSYSLLHASVLAWLLGHVYAGDFAQLLEQRVLTPLGMTHTDFADGDALLQGHAFGRETAHWHYSAFAGAAGLRSTLGDLLAFITANLKPEGSSLRGALLLARQAYAEGPAGGLGMGWNVHEVAGDGQTWPLIWRAGQTGGFSVFIGFRTDRQQGVVLLCNALADLAPIGIAWLSGSPAPDAPAAPYLPPADSTLRYPGLYRLASGTDMTVRLTPNGVAAQLRGQPAWRLVPIAEDVFVSEGGGTGITFLRNVDAISGLILMSGGTNVVAQRLSEGAPALQRAPIVLAADALAPYAGEFALDADTHLRVVRSTGGLVVQLTGSPPLAMQPFAADRFAGVTGINQLHYQRDDQGRIAGIRVDLAGGEREAKRVNWSTPRVGAYTPRVSAAPDQP